ncbi:MAG: hypothetical protein KDB20_07830 [Microthrixaceae bacterium]|nr:hypothetical protein [Microthrixaceae bacterium]
MTCRQPSAPQKSSRPERRVRFAIATLILAWATGAGFVPAGASTAAGEVPVDQTEILSNVGTVAPEATPSAKSIGSVVLSGDKMAVVIPLADERAFPLGSEATFQRRGSTEASHDCYVAARSPRGGVAALRCRGLDGAGFRAVRPAVAAGAMLHVVTDSVLDATASGYDTTSGRLNVVVQAGCCLPGTPVLNPDMDLVGLVAAATQPDQTPTVSTSAVHGNAVASIAQDAVAHRDKLIWQALAVSKWWVVLSLLAGALLGFGWALLARRPYLWRMIGVALLGGAVAVTVVAALSQGDNPGRFLG